MASRLPARTGLILLLLPPLLLLLLPLLSPCQSSAVDREPLSDQKICADAECRDVMYHVKAIRDYEAQDCRFVSFSKDDDVYVYYRLAGQREDLWLGMVGNKLGYFPKDVVEVQNNYSTTEVTLPTMDTDFSCSKEEDVISESAEYPDTKTPNLNEDSLAIDLKDDSEHTPRDVQIASSNEESNDKTGPDFSNYKAKDLTSSNNGGEHFSVPLDKNSTIYNEPGDSKVAAHTEVEGGESEDIVVRYKNSIMPDIKHPIDAEDVHDFVLEKEKPLPREGDTVKVVIEKNNLEILDDSEVMENNKEGVTTKKHITYEQVMGSNLPKQINLIETENKDAEEERSHGTTTGNEIETENNDLENTDNVYKQHDSYVSSTLESENDIEGPSFYVNSLLTTLNLSAPHYMEQNRDLAILKTYLREEMLSQLTEIFGEEGVIALETSLWRMDEKLQHMENALAHDVQRDELLDSVVNEFRPHILWWFKKVVDARTRQIPLNPEEDIHKDNFTFFSDVQEIISSLRQKYSKDVIEPENFHHEGESPSRPTPSAGVPFLTKDVKKTGSQKSGVAAAAYVPEMIQKFDGFILKITAALHPALQPFVMAITSWKPELSQSIVNYYGLPLDVSVLLILFAFILCMVFFCRICLVVRNRSYLKREAELVVQVKNIINEKNMLICQVVDTKVKLVEVETTMEETKGKLENSNDDSVALKAVCRRIEQELLQLAQASEALMEDLAAVRQEGEYHKEKLYEMKQNMEMLETTKALLEAQMKQLMPKVDASHAAEKKLQTELQAMQRTHQQLRDSTAQTDRETENCMVQSSELQEQLEQKRRYKEEMMATLACKEEELEVMANFLNEIRQFTLPSEQGGERRLVENGELNDSHSHVQKLKLRDLLDVEKLQATLEVTEEEIADLKTRYSNQLEENNKLQGVIQEREKKNTELFSESSHLKNELDFCRKKLQIVKEMYQEKESTLQKKLFVEQQARNLLETSPEHMNERAQQAMEEASTNKKQVQTLREELEKVECGFREQMAEFEKKAYENWLKTRSVERDLKASRQEVANLKQRMVELEYNMDLAEAQEMPPQNHGVPRSSSTPQGLAVGGSSLVGTPFTVSPVSIPPSPPRLTDEPRRAPSAPLGYRGLPGYGPERTQLNYDKRFPSPHPGYEPANELPESESNNYHSINDGNDCRDKVTNDEVDGKEITEVLSSRTSPLLRWGLHPRDYYNHGPGQGQHFELGLHRPQFPPPDVLQSREAHHYYRPQPMFHPFAPHLARVPPRDFPPHAEMYPSLPPLMNPMAGPPPPRGPYNMMPLRHFGPPPFFSSGPPVRLYGPPPPRGPYGLPTHLEPPQSGQIPSGLHPPDEVGISSVRDDENIHPVSSAGSDSSRP
ncbi:melanoma inhibitory activity protein 2-like [Lampetra fluviatilis]